VVWPASATDWNFASFDTTTWKLIKDSWSKASDFAPALTSDENYVTDAEKIVIWNTSWTNSWNETATTIWTLIWWAWDATPNDTDFIATSLTAWWILKKLTWTNAKAFLKTYFDTIYAPISIVWDMVLASVQTVTWLKTFDKDKLAMKGTSTGVNTISVANTSATSYTNTLPTKNWTIAMTDDIVSQVEDSIVDWHTTIAPSGNAVFDALALKAPLASPTFTGTVTLPKTTEIQDTTGDHQYVLAVSELTADRTVTLPLLTGADEFVFKDHTQTLTNKRINTRVVSTTSYTTDTWTSLDVSTCDEFIITAQAGALLFNNPSWTPTEWQVLVIRIKDNGTARALTYDTQFRASSDLALPTTTVLSKTMYMQFIFNITDTKWDLVWKIKPSERGLYLLRELT
jgi:hypothetical protein